MVNSPTALYRMRFGCGGRHAWSVDWIQQCRNTISREIPFCGLLQKCQLTTKWNCFLAKDLQRKAISLRSLICRLYHLLAPDATTERYTRVFKRFIRLPLIWFLSVYIVCTLLAPEYAPISNRLKKKKFHRSESTLRPSELPIDDYGRNVAAKWLR